MRLKRVCNMRKLSLRCKKEKKGETNYDTEEHVPPLVAPLEPQHQRQLRKAHAPATRSQCR
jgi:hypothetical protein